jgi:hypothetical protein
VYCVKLAVCFALLSLLSFGERWRGITIVIDLGGVVGLELLPGIS